MRGLNTPLISSCWVCVFVLITLASTGQTGNNGSPLKINVMPPSPEVASIGKYGQVPVGHYTGVPNISIPIFSAEGRKLSVPIGLSYHGGGIKVEEIASRVGLGWSLSAGGVISRTVRGLPDDAPNGWINNGFSVDSFLANPTSQVLIDISNGLIDSEPDLFFYSFNGTSGSFYFNSDREIIPIPYSKVKFVPRYDAINTIVGWILTNVDGTTYYFGLSKDGLRSAKDMSSNLSLCDRGFPSQTIDENSAWHLTEFFDYNEDEVIRLYYNDYVTETCFSPTQTKYIPISGFTGDDHVVCYNTQTLYGKRLDRIETDKHVATFVYGAQRVDLPGDNVLSAIVLNCRLSDQVIQDTLNPLMFNFNYSYFTSTTSYSHVPLCAESPSRLNRLKLDSVHFSSGTSQAQSFSFVYSPELLPDRLSFAQDHWGFFNGRLTNMSLIPEFEYTYSGSHFKVAGADRSIDTIYSKACTLTQIRYPTGGRSVFQYEGNTVLDNNVPAVLVNRSTTNVQGVPAQSSYSSNFTVSNANSIGAFVKFMITGVNCVLSEITCGIQFDIKGITDTGFSVNLNNIGELSELFLENGTYNIVVEIFSPNSDNENFSIIGSWKEQMADPNKPAGGLRIKSITNFDLNNNILLKRHFEYQIGSELTSGRITSYYRYAAHKAGMGNNGPEEFYQLSNVSKIPLGTTHGSYVGYGKVTEFTESVSKNGKIEYHFISPEASPDLFEDQFPFTPALNMDWSRGHNTKTTAYGTIVDSIAPLTESLTTYGDLGVGYPSLVDQTKGLAVGPVLQDYTSGVLFNHYYIGSGLRRPKIITTNEYSYDVSVASPKGTLTTSKKMHYDNPNHLQLTREIQFTSEGDSITHEMKYPQDMSLDMVMQEMVARNILNVPIEVTTTKNTTNVNGEKTIFEIQGAKLRAREKHLGKTQGGAAPLLFEKRLEYLYDPDIGNIVSYVITDNYPVSYIWGHGKVYPVAEVKNATSDRIFFESFEENGTLESIGNWARSGHRYWNSGNFDFISDANYVPSNTSDLRMSYWYWQGNAWRYYEGNFNNTIAMGTRLDDIRVYPSQAQMSTFTYNAHGKIETVTDSNNQTVRYLYDGHDRLREIVDHDGNPVKSFEYHYYND